uniref:Uncharacterized protein n=1 Tax=Pararge aegeria TaxID=116150 RepID=S4PBF6_9NEOP
MRHLETDTRRFHGKPWLHLTTRSVSRCVLFAWKIVYVTYQCKDSLTLCQYSLDAVVPIALMLQQNYV